MLTPVQKQSLPRPWRRLWHTKKRLLDSFPRIETLFYGALIVLLLAWWCETKLSLGHGGPRNKM